MSTLLVLRTSINGAQSVSNQMLDELIAQARAKWPDTHVVARDLAANPVPMLTPETVAAIRAGVTETAAQVAADALANELIEELKAADYIAIGLPRYNFHVPSQFKAYVDYIARPRVTFRYGANGPEGLLPNVPVYAFVASGGVYTTAESDPLSAWVRQVLGFVGLHQVELIHTEGVAMDAAAAMNQTRERIRTLVQDC